MSNVDSLKEILYEVTENGNHVNAVRGRGSSIDDLDQIKSTIKAEVGANSVPQSSFNINVK